MMQYDEGLLSDGLASSQYQEKRTRQYVGFAGIFLLVLFYVVSNSGGTLTLELSERNEALFDRRLNICHRIFHHGKNEPTPAPTAAPVAPPLPRIGTIVSGQTVRVTSQYQTTNLYPQSGDTRFQGNVCGAIQAVLAHPTNPDVCFAGSVNGGVWRTRNCRADFPDWTPLTDDQPSNSIADMKFDETDPNKMLVSIGRRSSFANLGGLAVGLLLSNNILADVPTWTVLNNAAGSVHFGTKEVEFYEVFMRGSLMMATAFRDSETECTNLGLWRSTNGGVTWTNVLKGFMYALAADPTTPTRFYVAGDFTESCSGEAIPNGVFRSDDSGATWTATTLPSLPEGAVENAKISVSASNGRVWASLVTGGKTNTISYSDNQGATWTAMDRIKVPSDESDGLHPKDDEDEEEKVHFPTRERPNRTKHNDEDEKEGEDQDNKEDNDKVLLPSSKSSNGFGGQGVIHFALLASATQSKEVYVGGDRQDTYNGGFPNYLDAPGYTGRIFRGDASVAATGATPSPQWKHMTDSNAIAGIPGGGTASGSGPHADTRDFAMRADGRLLVGDDGGIHLRTSPSDNTGDWFALCGTMQTFESHNVAYEPIFDSVIFGTQDCANFAGTLGDAGTFESVGSGDGNDVLIDFTSSTTSIYYYFAAQFLHGFYRLERSKATGVFEPATYLSQLGKFPLFIKFDNDSICNHSHLKSLQMEKAHFCRNWR